MTIKMLLIFVNPEMGVYKNALSIHIFKKTETHRTFKIGLSTCSGLCAFLIPHKISMHWKRTSETKKMLILCAHSVWKLLLMACHSCHT